MGDHTDALITPRGRSRRSRRRRTLAGGAFAALALAVGPLVAETGPIRGPGRDRADDSAEAEHAPLLERREGPLEPTFGDGRFVMRPVAPDPGRHRGGLRTDPGPGAPPRLTRRELTKLEMARRAVAAAKAAGTLFDPSPASSPTAAIDPAIAPPSPEEVEAARRRRLSEHRPVPLGPDPVAGVGP